MSTVTILEFWARVGKILRWFRGWREDSGEFEGSFREAERNPRGAKEESKRNQEEPKRKARAEEHVDNIIFGISPAAKISSQEENKRGQKEPKRSP